MNTFSTAQSHKKHYGTWNIDLSVPLTTRIYNRGASEQDDVKRCIRYGVTEWSSLFIQRHLQRFDRFESEEFPYITQQRYRASRRK